METKMAKPKIPCGRNSTRMGDDGFITSNCWQGRRRTSPPPVKGAKNQKNPTYAEVAKHWHLRELKTSSNGIITYEGTIRRVGIFKRGTWEHLHKEEGGLYNGDTPLELHVHLHDHSNGLT
jgi:hypothetical protein